MEAPPVLVLLLKVEKDHIIYDRVSLYRKAFNRVS